MAWRNGGSNAFPRRTVNLRSGLGRRSPRIVPTTFHDSLSRPLRDLRLSVTDRCNFRCGYCMPKEVFGRGYDFLPKESVLTFEEYARLARVFVSLGVEKSGSPVASRCCEGISTAWWRCSRRSAGCAI